MRNKKEAASPLLFLFNFKVVVCKALLSDFRGLWRNSHKRIVDKTPAGVRGGDDAVPDARGLAVVQLCSELAVRTAVFDIFAKQHRRMTSCRMDGRGPPFFPLYVTGSAVSSVFSDKLSTRKAKATKLSPPTQEERARGKM